MNRTLRSHAVLPAAVLALSGCVPIPGSSVNITACIGCFDAEASARIGAPPGDSAAPEPPAPLPAQLHAGAPAATDTQGSSPGEDPQAPASSVEPARAAPGAGSGEGDPPVPTGPLADRVRVAEGLSLTPYEDDGGVKHICYGHRVTIGDCDALLAEDLAAAEAGAERVVGEPTWSSLTERRREVLTEIALMTGATGLSRFERMLEALHAGDWTGAADEIVLSNLKPPTRAVALANLMRDG